MPTRRLNPDYRLEVKPVRIAPFQARQIEMAASQLNISVSAWIRNAITEKLEETNEV